MIEYFKIYENINQFFNIKYKLITPITLKVYELLFEIKKTRNFIICHIIDFIIDSFDTYMYTRLITNENNTTTVIIGYIILKLLSPMVRFKINEYK